MLFFWPDDEQESAGDDKRNADEGRAADRLSEDEDTEQGRAYRFGKAERGRSRRRDHLKADDGEEIGHGRSYDAEMERGKHAARGEHPAQVFSEHAGQHACAADEQDYRHGGLGREYFEKRLGKRKGEAVAGPGGQREEESSGIEIAGFAPVHKDKARHADKGGNVPLAGRYGFVKKRAEYGGDHRSEAHGGQSSHSYAGLKGSFKEAELIDAHAEHGKEQAFQVPAFSGGQVAAQGGQRQQEQAAERHANSADGVGAGPVIDDEGLRETRGTEAESTDKDEEPAENRRIFHDQKP